MKLKAQITVSVLFILSFIKSFKYPSNSYDIVFILVCASIYIAYELITDHKMKSQVSKLITDTESKFKEVEKEVKDTKNYVSSMSIGSAFNRK